MKNNIIRAGIPTGVLLVVAIALPLSAAMPAVAQTDTSANSSTFKTFTAQVYVNEKTRSFTVTGNLALSEGSDGIHPLKEDMALEVGSFVLVVPARSFRPTWSRGFLFTKAVGGLRVEIAIQPFDRGQCYFVVLVTGVVPSADTLRVTLTVGNESGSAEVKPNLLQLASRSQ